MLAFFSMHHQNDPKACNNCIWIRGWTPWGCPTSIAICGDECEEDDMKQPPLGWTTVAELDRTTDGDTIVVTIKRQFIIRLVDDEIYFDTPETYRPKSEEERELGKKATEHLKELIEGKELVIHIPADERGRMKDVTQLGRFGGMLWADGEDVVDNMIEAGYVKKQDV